MSIGHRKLEVYIAEKVRTIEYYKKHIANLEEINPPKDAEQLAEKYGKVIEELEKEVETRIDVVSEIENQYTYAKNNGHTNSAIKALEVLSRIRSAKEDEAPKNVAEIENEIIKYLEVLGEKETSKLFLKCDFFADEEQEEDLDEVEHLKEKIESIPKRNVRKEYLESREGHVLK